MAKFSDWLTKKYLAWQAESGEKKTIKEFGEYLGISLGVMNNYLNKGQSPRGLNVAKLASKLGDEIYDILGVEKPRWSIAILMQLIEDMNEEDERDLIEEARKIAKRKKTKGEPRTHEAKS